MNSLFSAPRMDEDEPPIDFTSGSPADFSGHGGLDQDDGRHGFDEHDLDRPSPSFGGLGNIDLSDDDNLTPTMAKPLPVTAESQGKKGTVVLWLLGVLFVLIGLGGAGYYFQDTLVSVWPGAHDALNQVGLRREKLGDGLELRNAGNSERFVQNDTEVLIVRGIVANVSDRERRVPLMKLVLMDKDDVIVQDKTQQPPATTLDPGGTAGFRFVVERPNPNAVKALVVFAEAPDSSGK